MSTDNANNMQDYHVFGEYGGVNPSITDSATFTFMTTEKMQQLFSEEVEGCFLYSRHLNPSSHHLSQAIAAMEGTEDAQVMGSGMGAISSTLMQICSSGDEIISSRTIYGGSYAIMKNFFPKFGINTHFVDITDLEVIKSKINEHTKVIYCETISNPLLEIADLREIRKICDEHDIKLVVDNTFSPLVVSPIQLGAHIVVYSLTKYINGMNDTTGGAVCGTHEFICSLKSVNDGAAMLLGPVFDSYRASNVLKNMRTLHIRMVQHSKNGMYMAKKLEEAGVKIFYPGLPSHPQHELIKSMINPEFGYSSMITIDAKDEETANKFMMAMQDAKVGFFAVSLGFYKTLFSSPGSSTSSEIPKEEQDEMGMTSGLVRFSVGLDMDIERSYKRVEECMKKVGMI
ncbi:MAG: aminotransferase class I/II-fold pyridoxal phosphate-dependent enzyme [Candidatus Kapabacteria bacterium]|jgi:methionine-gamma-lyase|nr:aminotransferase class I/II-fold pyridoxal phosphate-dependent enzyme [Candidatus Kapabacteria bacterium]